MSKGLGMNFLVIGSGNISKRHVQNLKQLYPLSKITLVKRNLGEKEGFESVDKIVTSIEEAMTQDFSAAIVASPAPFHIDHSLKLLKRNTPLIIEKPLSFSLKEGLDFSQKIKFVNAPILLGYSFRFNEVANYLFNYSKNKSIESIKIVMRSNLKDWRPGVDYRESVSAQKKLGGGVLLELSHAIDLYNWFLGVPGKVECRLSRKGKLEIDVEDTADLLLDKGSIYLDMIKDKPQRFFEISFQNEVITWDMIGDKVTSSIRGEIYSPSRNSWQEMYVNELEHFFSCVDQNKKEICTVLDGVKAMAVIEACRDSSNLQKEISLKDYL